MANPQSTSSEDLARHASLAHRIELAEHHRAQLEAVFQAVADGIVVFDMQGNVVLVNEAEARITGYASSDEMLRDIAYFTEVFELRTPDGKIIPVEEWPVSRVMRGESLTDLQVRGRRTDTGQEWFFSYSGEPVRDEEGTEILALVITRDITAQKAAEAERERLIEALCEADRRKTDFLGVLSHELRNPLTPIRNSLFILGHVDANSPQAKRAIGVIDRQTEHLGRLIDDLLDVTRITRGKVQLQHEQLDLTTIVTAAVEDYRSLFAGNGVGFDTQLAGSSLPIRGDATRIAQIVGNLLQNAAKFTPRGGRTVLSLSREDGRAVLRVADTGPGISRDLQPHLFEPFMQADKTLDRTQGGLGLGLALVKGLVELHAGEIALESAAGEGAVFAVRLPLSNGAPKVARVDGEAEAKRTRLQVLIVEDNEDAAESLRDALELDDYEVEIAHDAHEGLAKARSFHPQVILCDIGLPGMDGYEFAAAVRKDEALKDLPLIALSGYARDEDRQHASEAGFNLHLAKPPRLDKLQKAVDELANQASRAGRAKAADSPEL